MIISKGSRYHIVNNTLCRSIYSLENGEDSIDIYNLQQLSDITTIEPIEIDAERQEKLRCNSVKKGVATGAVVGAVVDVLNPGDSIIDGIILGALAGWLFAADKKEPVAHLTLRFNDGVSLPVILGREDLTQMMAIIETSKHQSRSEAGASHTLRRLTPDEMATLQRHSAKEKSSGLALLTFILSFIVLMVLFDPIESDKFVSFIDGLSAVFTGVGKALGYSIVFSGLFSFCSYRIFLRPKVLSHNE